MNDGEAGNRNAAGGDAEAVVRDTDGIDADEVLPTAPTTEEEWERSAREKKALADAFDPFELASAGKDGLTFKIFRAAVLSQPIMVSYFDTPFDLKEGDTG